MAPPVSQNGEVEEENDASFKRFDVVSDDSDHYYASQSSKPPKKDGAAAAAAVGDSALISGGKSAVHKKIMQEWRILEKHLPDSIYVQAYEKRIDLLRAVIVGAAGTPYHDGLFFFDIAFPPDYPSRPPMVYYRSHGMRLNPNLYANGRVCLSLLNTWVGKKSEKWNPSESTVLQVLVSIQALVLNEKPYFNEPGSGIFGQARWEKSSQAYNEDVFLLSCKTTLFLLRKPPKNFEAFTAAHYRRQASTILEACLAYSRGRVRVGYYRDDEDAQLSSSSSLMVSRRFRVSMNALYPELLAAFIRNGASLGTFVEQLKLRKETTSSKAKSLGKGGNEIVKKVIGKIKLILGLKKKQDSAEGNVVSNSILKKKTE